MRKDLLIAESELNRVQLMDEWDAATEWHRTLSAGARTVGSLASAAALVVSGLRAFRRKRDARNSTGTAWSEPFIKGAGFISSLWEVFRSRGCDQKNKQHEQER
jgi:hypothetical protein